MQKVLPLVAVFAMISYRYCGIMRKMPNKKKTVERNESHALPLCPDCKIAMKYENGGPINIVPDQLHFELVCPHCKKKLSELLLSPKPPHGSKESYPNRNKMEKLRKIVDEFNRLPVLDKRSPEDILGYDEYGVPQ